MALVDLQVTQEGRDGARVEVVPVQSGGDPAGPGVHELQQQLQGIAVGRDRARADLTLLGEPIGEECLQGWGRSAS
jgi:hypothetical protein